MGKNNRFFKRLKYFILSKYFIITIFLAFFVVIMFFDKNSRLEQQRVKKEIAELKKEIEKNEQTVKDLQFYLEELKSNSPDFIEKYAREHYQMKAENEDVFFDE